MSKNHAPAIAVLITLGVAAGPAVAQSAKPPYDDRLVRLSEIAGSVHYLRKLCSGADEGWREKMQDLIDTEADSAQRRARLIATFNRGYRSLCVCLQKLHGLGDRS